MVQVSVDFFEIKMERLSAGALCWEARESIGPWTWIFSIISLPGKSMLVDILLAPGYGRTAFFPF